MGWIRIDIVRQFGLFPGKLKLNAPISILEARTFRFVLSCQSIIMATFSHQLHSTHIISTSNVICSKLFALSTAIKNSPFDLSLGLDCQEYSSIKWVDNWMHNVATISCLSVTLKLPDRNCSSSFLHLAITAGSEIAWKFLHFTDFVNYSWNDTQSHTLLLHFRILIFVKERIWKQSRQLLWGK